MDEFGVLVESVGFKAQGKSAPMAKLKAKPKSHFNADNIYSTSSFHDASSLPVDELDGIFRSNVNISQPRQSQNLYGDDDLFGVPVSSSDHFGGIDLESVLGDSSKKNSGKIPGNLSSSNSGGFGSYDDLLGLKSEHSVDDLFGSFKGNSTGKVEKKDPGFDDLIPGFGRTSAPEEGVQSKKVFPPGSTGHQLNSNLVVEDDPFSVFGSSASHSKVFWPFPGPPGYNAKKDPVQSSADEFDDFVMGKTQNDSRTDTKASKPSNAAASNGFQTVDDLDALFGGGAKMNHTAKPTVIQDDGFNVLFDEEKRAQKPSSRSSFSTTKAQAVTNITNDFGSLFGDISVSSGEFQEIEGEPAERRKARLSRHMRMNARIAEALAEKNQRDFQSQQEQEEKHRLAETLDYDIKRWASGKEGNLRALLSSLQQVLWPECGWRPVSLTDMITSESVKKVYKKATLSVHPDKVQQKGATVQQKYIAEKVFDILKEAWNKFSAEELR